MRGCRGRRRFCGAGRRHGTGRERGRHHRARPGRRGRRGRPLRPRSLPGGFGPSGGAGRADRGNPRAGTAARPGCWPGRQPAAHRCPGAGSGCAGSGRARTDAGERPADALAGDGGVGQGLLQPVLAQGVPFGVGQVPGRGCFQEGLRQRRSHAQAAGIHRRVDQRRRGGRRVAVPGQQLGRPGQELDDLPVLRPRRPGPAARLPPG